MTTHPIPKACYELLRKLTEKHPDIVPAINLSKKLRKAAIVCEEYKLILRLRIPSDSPDYDEKPKCWWYGPTAKGQAWLAEWELQSDTSAPSRPKLSPSVILAHEQREYAQQMSPCIKLGQPGDVEAYHFLKKRKDNKDGNKPTVRIETWLRYLRAWRRALEDAHDRELGGNVILQNQI